jgi:hypothetical protein
MRLTVIRDVYLCVLPSIGHPMRATHPTSTFDRVCVRPPCLHSPNHRFYPERGGSLPHDPRTRHYVRSLETHVPMTSAA